MIDDRLRAAAQQLSERVVAEAPPLGRHRRPLAPSTTAPAKAVIPFVPCQTQGSSPPPPTPNPEAGTLPELPGGTVMPDGQLVCGDTRTAIIEGLLADVPVPAGFEVPAYGTNGPSWFSLIGEVSAAVVCAWLDEWFIAQDAGDAVGMGVAAAALDTTRDWEMLNKEFMAGRAEDVSKWADAVNGRGGIGTAAGVDVRPTRELAESALVCTWRHR